MAKDTNCNCLHGTAGFDANGNCVCTDDGGYTEATCTGVWIDGRCTGGVKGGGIATVNEPLPDTSAGGQFSMFGQKRKVINTCSQIGAPKGYHYILDSSGRCVLAVDYDNDTTHFNTGVPAIDNLLGGGISQTIANNKGLIGLAVASVVGYFVFKGNKGTATERTTINRKY